MIYSFVLFFFTESPCHKQMTSVLSAFTDGENTTIKKDVAFLHVLSLFEITSCESRLCRTKKVENKFSFEDPLFPNFTRETILFNNSS